LKSRTPWRGRLHLVIPATSPGPLTFFGSGPGGDSPPFSNRGHAVPEFFFSSRRPQMIFSTSLPIEGRRLFTFKTPLQGFAVSGLLPSVRDGGDSF